MSIDLSGIDFSQDGALEEFLRGSVFRGFRSEAVPADAKNVNYHHIASVQVVEDSAFITVVYGRENYARKFADSEGRSLIALSTDAQEARAAGLVQHVGGHAGGGRNSPFGCRPAQRVPRRSSGSATMPDETTSTMRSGMGLSRLNAAEIRSRRDLPGAC